MAPGEHELTILYPQLMRWPTHKADLISFKEETVRIQRVSTIRGQKRLSSRRLHAVIDIDKFEDSFPYQRVHKVPIDNSLFKRQD